MTVKDDVMNVTVTDYQRHFCTYELERLDCLKLNVDEFRTEVPDFKNTEILDVSTTRY